MEDEKITFQDQIIDLLSKNNAKLIEYIMAQIEIKYGLTQTDIKSQDIQDAIQQDKDWTEEE